MIPPLEPTTGYLPAGIHEATWQEFVARFGGTSRRLLLLAGLKTALDMLRHAGCRRAYIDGSFVTAKREPADFDGCWEIEGVNEDLIDPVLFEFANSRAAQKQKYGGELFIADWPANLAGTLYLDFFQRDREDNPKGIVGLDLEHLP